jgi:protein-tyrosine phosphatase
MARPTVPAPRYADRYRVGFVCSGNICRSPTAEVVLAARAVEAGLPVEVVSSGLGDWHVGDPMDPRSAAMLRDAGYDPDRHRAQQFARRWFDEVDLVLAMDAGHLRELRRVAPRVAAHRVLLFGTFDPTSPGADVPDPYYGGPEGFEEVLAMVERTCAALLRAIEAALGTASR